MRKKRAAGLVESAGVAVARKKRSDSVMRIRLAPTRASVSKENARLMAMARGSCCGASAVHHKRQGRCGQHKSEEIIDQPRAQNEGIRHHPARPIQSAIFTACATRPAKLWEKVATILLLSSPRYAKNRITGLKWCACLRTRTFPSSTPIHGWSFRTCW